jgi:signal peptidase I
VEHIENIQDKEELVKTEVEEIKKSSSISEAISFIGYLVVFAIIFAAIRLFVIQPFIVEGQSMEPSFENYNYLITEKVSFYFSQPQRGEVVIFHPPDSPSINYIKRIIGLPGETVEVKNGGVYVNGTRLDEPYLASNEETLSDQATGTKVTLGQDQFFVMGDNREHSRDSRELGPIPKGNIVSRVWFRLLPINNIKSFAPVKYSPAPS